MPSHSPYFLRLHLSSVQRKDEVLKPWAVWGRRGSPQPEFRSGLQSLGQDLALTSHTPLVSEPGESPSGCPRRMVGRTGTVPTWVGNTPICDNLHQQDSEGPHISLDGKNSEVDGLWGSPFDGELGPCQESVVAPGQPTFHPQPTAALPHLPVPTGGLAGCTHWIHKDIGRHSHLLLTRSP